MCRAAPVLPTLLEGLKKKTPEEEKHLEVLAEAFKLFQQLKGMWDAQAGSAILPSSSFLSSLPSIPPGPTHIMLKQDNCYNYHSSFGFPQGQKKKQVHARTQQTHEPNKAND